MLRSDTGVYRFQWLITLLQWKIIAVVLPVVYNVIVIVVFFVCLFVCSIHPFSLAGAQECVWRGHPGGAGASWDQKEVQVCPAIEELRQWEIWWYTKQVGQIVRLLAGHYDSKGKANGLERHNAAETYPHYLMVYSDCAFKINFERSWVSKKNSACSRCSKCDDSPFSQSLQNCSVFSMLLRWGRPPCLSLSLLYKLKNKTKIYSVTWY